jgi:hypothetical protein
MFYDHLVGRPEPKNEIYERAIKAPPSKPSVQIQTKSDDWSENKLNRRQAQDRIRKFQEFMTKNWRLRLLFERGRVDPLRQALRDETSKKRAASKTVKPSSKSKKKAQ